MFTILPSLCETSSVNKIAAGVTQPLDCKGVRQGIYHGSYSKINDHKTTRSTAAVDYIYILSPF